MCLTDIMRRTNMKYTPSINIAQTTFNPAGYIVTQNALGVIGNIVDSFNAGVHSFNIIGSYGTGKSNFILALEHGLQKGSKLITNKGQFNGFIKFRFEKIVGDYASLQKVLAEHLFPTNASDNLFENLRLYFKQAEKREEFVVLVIDEFGKLLEYAAKNTPERELYLLQKFTEFINDERRNAILITTLHQNFNSYARTLTESQRNEWTKVKGRFKEIVFNEPVEQLLYLASKRIEKLQREVINQNFEHIYNLAITSKFASSSITYDTALSLIPSQRQLEQEALLSKYSARLSRRGVTVKSLYKEYHKTRPNGYKHASFGNYLMRYRMVTHVVGHIEHYAGDQIYIDFASDKLEIIDNENGECRSVEMFVSILPCSHYTYCEAVWSQSKQDLIKACENALHFYGDIPMAIVPDNLKAAVARSNHNGLVINEEFAAFSEHYGCTVYPARVRHPKDKALVENAV